MYTVYCDSYLIFDSKLESLKIFNPKVDLELNKTGSFTFSIYPSHPCFDMLKRLKSIIRVYQGGHLLFRGRILNDKQGFHNEKQVTCEGELAFLLDSVQRPYDFQSGENHTTIGELFTFFIENHNAQVDDEHKFKVGDISVTDPNNYIVRSDTQYLNTWESINKKLIETHGGYLFVRHEADGNYIDYVADFDRISSQSVEFGKNLLNLNKITKGEDIATAIIPLGAKLKDSAGNETAERLTIASVNNGVDYVYNQEAVDAYGKIYRKVIWEDVTEAANLKRKAEEHLADAINQIVTIELDAVDMAMMNTDISAFRMGTYIPVRTKPHSLDSRFLVKKLSIQLLNPKSNKLTLGTTYSTFTESVSNSGQTVGSLVERVENVERNFSTDTILQNLTESTSSQISQTSDEIMFQVSESVYFKDDVDALVSEINTQFSQTREGFDFIFNEFNADLNDIATGTDARFSEISKYIRFVDGDIILGEEGNELTLKISNDRISFLEGSAEVAYFSNNKLYVTDGEYINSLKIGNFSFMPRTNGNFSIKKVT